MKKVIKTLGLVAMTALIATSCNKKEEMAEFNVSFGETYGLEAGPSLNGQKAYIDAYNGYTFKWNEGDKLLVYNLAEDYTNSVHEEYTADPGSEGKHSTRFTGPSVGDRKDIGFFVFYNPSKAHGDLKQGNRETFEVPATQNYDPRYLIDPTSLVMASTLGGTTTNQITNLTLNHVFGFLNVAVGNLSGDKQRHVSSIVVTDTRHLTGELDLYLPEVSASEFSGLFDRLEQYGPTDPTYIASLNQYLGQVGYHAHGDLGKTITLNCGNKELPYLYWDFFFITLRPGALYNGFSVTVNFSDAGVAPITVNFEGAAAMNYLIKPAWFKNLYIVTEGEPLQYN
jgi:hypothetical protein